MNPKEITIKMMVGTDNQHILTAWKTKGYKKDNVSDLLEILGLVENFKQMLLKKIKTKGKFQK